MTYKCLTVFILDADLPDPVYCPNYVIVILKVHIVRDYF